MAAIRKLNDPTVNTRLAEMVRRLVPTRDQLAESRWIRPLARRQELWRLTRRSVPRGVAIGLLVGIFALIPGIQIVGAALLCVPCRGNIPIAAAMTFLSNPATTPLIIAASLYIGNRAGFHADLSSFMTLYHEAAGLEEWFRWLVSDAAPALLAGLLIISIVAAALGYLVSSFIWREIVGRKRRARLERAIERAIQASPAE